MALFLKKWKRKSGKSKIKEALNGYEKNEIESVSKF
jgi:hypothetical protein